MTNKSKKAIAKVCDSKGSRIIFIPKKLDIELKKDEYLTLEVLDKDTIKIKRV